MTRRNFILAMLAFTASSQLANLFPLSALRTTPSKEGLVMRDGWILLETDL